MSRQELSTLISKFVTEQVKSSEVTTRASLSYLQGMFFVIIAVLQVLESIDGFPQILPRTMRYLMIGMICSGLLLIPAGISWILHSALQSIPFIACALLLIIFGAIQKKLIPNFLWIPILGNEISHLITTGGHQN